MKQEELLKCCYDWQIGNLKWKNWAGSLRGKLYKMGQVYIWHKGKDWDIRLICQKTVNRYNDIESQDKIQRMREKSKYLLGDIEAREENYVHLVSWMREMY